MSLTESNEGVIVEVYVKPNNIRFQIALEDNEIVIHSTEEPIRNKVNKELIRELTKLFQTRVQLVSGATSKKKRFLIVGIKKAKVLQILELNKTS
jgi:uncharacterized protein (TIGR00251 family)